MYNFVYITWSGSKRHYHYCLASVYIKCQCCVHGYCCLHRKRQSNSNYHYLVWCTHDRPNSGTEIALNSTEPTVCVENVLCTTMNDRHDRNLVLWWDAPNTFIVP